MKPVQGYGDEELLCRIRELGPWHTDLQLTDTVRVSDAYPGGPAPGQRFGVCNVEDDRKDSFLGTIDQIYPGGLAGKTLLDPACNAGCYCFWAAERDAVATGFDVREHWIKQARFVKAVRPTSRTRFVVGDLRSLPSMGLGEFDVGLFNGIFYHLPDPMHGLELVARLTREVLIVNTATTLGERDGYLKCYREPSGLDNVLHGVDGLAWLPTGPGVVADILRWLGFDEIKLIFHHEKAGARRGRMMLAAAREGGRLAQVDGVAATP